MQSWKAFATAAQEAANQAGQAIVTSVGSVDSSRIKSTLQTLQQTVKERTGSANDVTELPQEYLDLERRVDSLRQLHLSMISVAKVYESQSYDYPVQLRESLNEFGGSVAHTFTYLAAAATKGTNLPQPAVVAKPTDAHKTLPHALSRAASAGAVEVGPSRLADSLKTFSAVQDKIGTARIEQDEEISKNFLQPWSSTVNSSIAAALKSRAAVKHARILLDACRESLKNATGGPKQEQARMEVEAAEEKLVNETEQAINLMRGVLENPEPQKNIAAFLKAQQLFYSQAAKALEEVQAEMDEAVTLAEAEYRKSRAQ